MNMPPFQIVLPIKAHGTHGKDQKISERDWIEQELNSSELFAIDGNRIVV